MCKEKESEPHKVFLTTADACLARTVDWQELQGLKIERFCHLSSSPK